MNIIEIKKNLDRAFKLISTIHVKDMDVEAMFAAKQALRQAYAMLEEGGGDNGGQAD